MCVLSCFIKPILGNRYQSRPRACNSFQFNLIYFEVWLGPRPLRCSSLTRLPMWEPKPGPLLTNHSCSAVGAQIIILRSDDLVVPKLLACGCEWWSQGEDLSRHQQEVTGGQLVTMSLVPGTVDSGVSSECHLCCSFSFFLYLRRPNLINGTSGWQAPD